MGGCQGNDKEGGKEGTKQEISSPWDIAVGPGPGMHSYNNMYMYNHMG